MKGIYAHSKVPRQHFPPFPQPHSGLRRGFRPEMGRKSVTLSSGTPPCPYPIAYRRAYGLSFRWTVLKNLRSPLRGSFPIIPPATGGCSNQGQAIRISNPQSECRYHDQPLYEENTCKRRSTFNALSTVLRFVNCDLDPHHTADYEGFLGR
jgi:hypothetical protein